MPPSIFSLDDDARAFMVRVTASLERVDGAVAEGQLLIRESQALIADVRQLLAAFTAAAAMQKKP